MDPFFVKVLISFVVGSIYLPIALWIAEKFGSKLGGIIVTLPSTFLISFVFIAWTQDTQAAMQSLPIVPLVLGIDAVFIALYAALQRYGSNKALLASVTLWALAGLPLAFSHFSDIILATILAIPLFAAAIYYLQRVPHRRATKIKGNAGTLAFRGIFAGTVIAAAVFLGRELGPSWGGLFGNFPAAIFSTLYLLNKAHGKEFAASTGKAAAYCLVANTSFSIALFNTVPLHGVVQGVTISYLVALASGAIMYKVMK